MTLHLSPLIVLQNVKTATPVGLQERRWGVYPSVTGRSQLRLEFNCDFNTFGDPVRSIRIRFNKSRLDFRFDLKYLRFALKKDLIAANLFSACMWGAEHDRLHEHRVEALLLRLQFNVDTALY